MRKRTNPFLQNRIGLAFTVGLAITMLLFVGNLVGFSRNDGQLSGRILLWHSLNEADATVLDDILDSFGALNPKTNIQATYISPETLLDRYQTASDSGLGPDLFLGPSAWVPTLASAGLIRPPYPERVGELLIRDELMERYTPTILTTVRFDDALYALPLAVDTQGLYFNRRLADGAVQTLDDLLQEADSGKPVLLGTQFADAFWGIGAFGGRLLGEDGQHVVLDRGGFANWLNWLKSARKAQGMILDADHRLLQERFLAGNAAYFVGHASELSTIQQALGAENVGVTHLPVGPTGNPRPLLTTEAFFFNPASTPQQQATAESLAIFVTNAEQSATLMRKTNRVPANRQAQINQRLSPEIANFDAQIRTSIALPHNETTEQILLLGDQAYQLVLEDGTEPAEAAVQITRQMNNANGLSINENDEVACPQLGVVTLLDVVDDAHNGIQSDVLDELVRRFNGLCPNVRVTHRRVDAEMVRDEFGSPNRSDSRVSLLLAPRALLADMVAAEKVRDITELVDAEAQQQYLPAARDAFRMQGKLYGLPALLGVNALYYNRSLVENPARTLDELINFASTDTGASISTELGHAFWVLPALSGNINFASDEAEQQLETVASGLIAWLEWLRTVRQVPGFLLSAEDKQLREHFVSGSGAYYIGGPQLLPELQQALGKGPAGEELLGVTTLPAGAAGNAGPLLTTYGFMFEPQATDAQVALGLAFLQYATGEAGQSFLATQLNLAPANITAEVGELLATFVDQSATAITFEDESLVHALGPITTVAVQLVLDDDVEPASALVIAAQTIGPISNSILDAGTLEWLIAFWQTKVED